MQQIWIPRYGGPEVLELREAPDPTPGPGEVRIQVAAAGVNFADHMARMGIYPDGPPPPCVVGYEVSGTIDAVGEGVDPDRVGERVCGLTRFGGYSSVVCVPAGHAATLPEGVGLVEAAALPVQGLTAWLMVEEFGRVRAGDRVLVHAAGGGVGLMALELIKAHGAFAAGTASASKHDWLRERGYDQLVDYRNHDFHEVLKDEEPFDLVLDAVGGASWTKGLDLLRAGGKLVCFGMSSNAQGSSRNPLVVARNLMAVPWLQMNPISLMHASKAVCGVNMGRLWHEAPRLTGWLRVLLERHAAGNLRVQVHAEVPFGEAAEAHGMLMRRENVGKVVLVT